MEFNNQIRQFSKRVEALKGTIMTEEATKTAIIMPFFSMLGYDVFNPQEFVPEFVADVGIKKGEKVDYAIMRDNQPVILIECKAITEKLEKHDSQLFRYFGTTNAKFAILTNGLIYNFYTDLDNPNKMDEAPFLSVNIMAVKDSQIAQLKKFCKSEFDIDSIFTAASDLRYINEFKSVFAANLEYPDDDFVRYCLHTCYTAPKTQNVLEKFRPIVKKALSDYINETMNDKIKSALGNGEEAVPAPAPIVDEPVVEEDKGPRIVTTEEELEAYFLVKSILSDVVSFKDICYKDTESYMGVLYKGNIRKWICRFQLNEGRKYLFLPTEDKKQEKYVLQDIYDISKYSNQLHAVLARYM